MLSFSVSVQRAWNFEEFFEFAATQLDLKAFETESKHLSTAQREVAVSKNKGMIGSFPVCNMTT